MATEEQEVKLVGFWASPFVYRVEWALKLKGVPYKYIEEDLFNRTPLLSKINPVYNKVPVLVHNDKPIPESLQILELEYIDETWKQFPLFPSDPHERAMARFWAKFAEEKLLVAAWTAKGSEGETKEEALKTSKEVIGKIEEELIKRKTKFFGGERIGYLDLALGWISHWLPVWEEVGSMKIVDPVQFPATADWMANFSNHPVIMESLPDKYKMIELFGGGWKKLVRPEKS